MDPTNVGVQLSELVLALRRPSRNAFDVKRKLQRVAYLLPLIKNPQNLAVVVVELSNSPGAFTSVETVLFAVDAISAAHNYKLRVSDPTISASEWSAELLKAAFSVPPLVGLIVAAGLRAVSETITFANAVCTPDTPRDLMAAAAACLSRAQWAFKRETYAQLPCALVVPAVLAVLYTPANLTLQETPIDLDMGSWSRLLSGLLGEVGPNELTAFLDTVSSFVRLVVAQQYDAEKYKPLFFGVVIQLEGLATQVLVSRLARPQRLALAAALLSVIQPLGFVVEMVGAQFDSYQFILNVAIDALSTDPRAAAEEMLVLGSNWAFGRRLGPSVAEAGEIVFFFDTGEQLMPVLTANDAEQIVLPVASRFLDLGIHTSVFEAAHSVMLAYLATHKNSRFSKSVSALAYFDQLVELFPAPLSYHQFLTAVSAVLAAVPPPQAQAVLNQIFKMGKSAQPGTPLPGEGDGQPPTVRAALVSTLAHCVVQVSDAPQLQTWLHLIGQMIPGSYSDMTAREAQWIRKDLADVITGLGLSVSDVGIRWWFGEAKM